MHTWEYLESSANYPKMVLDRYIMNLEQHCIFLVIGMKNMQRLLVTSLKEKFLVSRE